MEFRGKLLMRSVLTIVVATCLFIPCILATAVLANDEQKSNSTNQEANSKKTQTNDREETLDFSSTGRPGQQTAGESRGNCPNATDSLRAILPVSHSGKTTTGYPSFWFYVPDTSEQVNQVEFVLQNEAREDILRSPVKLKDTPGYNHFSLPKTASPLKVGKWYRWYVKVYCDSQLASSQFVQGWINRMPVDSDLYLELQNPTRQSYLIYGSRGIWYDAINELLSLYTLEPSNMALEQDWKNFTRAKGVNLQELPNFGTALKAVSD
jgi:Domain of Unknown Function (DUF928)